LGPKLWSRPALTMPTSNGNEDYSVMNIDDFLSENGFDLNEGPESPGDSTDQEQSEIGIESPRSNSDMDMDQERDEIPYKKIQKSRNCQTQGHKGRIWRKYIPLC